MERHIPNVLTLHAPTGAEVPVIFDSPHSGTVYPEDFGFAIDYQVLRKGEDTFVHELFDAAPANGAHLLEAHFPRTYIDPNRPEDDIDEKLLNAPWPGPLNPGIKTKSGIGLVWRLAFETVPIYGRILSIGEVQNRIETYHRPYHGTLDESVASLKKHFGKVWHINCHSMPALSDARSPEGPGIARPDFCLGDRDGTTAEPGFVRFVFDFLKAKGYNVAINDPYKGVELVRRYGDPANGSNSLQIEINRRLHINEDTREKNENFARLKADVDALVGAICGYAKKFATD